MPFLSGIPHVRRTLGIDQTTKPGYFEDQLDTSAQNCYNRLAKQRLINTSPCLCVKVLRLLMREVFQDEASAKLLRKIWNDQREQTDAAAPPEALFHVDEGQVRKNRSLSELPLFQGVGGSRVLSGRHRIDCMLRGCSQRSPLNC